MSSEANGEFETSKHRVLEAHNGKLSISLAHFIWSNAERIGGFVTVIKKQITMISNELLVVNTWRYRIFRTIGVDWPIYIRFQTIIAVKIIEVVVRSISNIYVAHSLWAKALLQRLLFQSIEWIIAIILCFCLHTNYTIQILHQLLSNILKKHELPRVCMCVCVSRLYVFKLLLRAYCFDAPLQAVLLFL